MKVLMILFVVLLAGNSRAVIEGPLTAVDFEQNPPELKWRHIVSENFDVIFPEEIEDEAHRVVHLLEKSYPFLTRSLETKPPRIPVVLQNQSVISNGFVTLAPRRSEWYVSPPTDPELGNTEWLKTLAIHEFRHVVQFQKTRQGFNKFLEIILGEVGQAIGIGLTLPPWFLEGDAVGMETALTKGGRGRLPLFERDLRTILLSGQSWNYDKAHLRSYKDYVPNHYVYGYFYTSWLRNTYGDLFLSKLADTSADSSWNPLSFYRATDKLTGKSFEEFYANVMRDLISEWKKRADELRPTLHEVKNLSSRFGYTNYLYPQFLSEHKMVALKRGLSFFDRFVIFDGRKEKILYYPGPLINEQPYKLRDGKLAFLELEIDPRWGYRDFTRLKVLDVHTKKIILNKAVTKLRSIVINPDGKSLLGVEWDTTQGQSIVVLNMAGEVIQKIPYPKTRIITSVDWYRGNEIVMVVRDHNDQKSLVNFNFSSNTETNLIDATFTNLGFVTVEEGKILFESPESGIDNIWHWNGEKSVQLTSSLFGAYAPTMFNGQLYYNDYTVDGMNIVEKKGRWEEEEKSQGSFYPIYEKFATSEKAEDLESEYLKKNTYQSKRYSQLGHAINIHSWLLLAPPLSSTIELAVFSRDILNKFTLAAGTSYNLNERTIQGFVSSSWSHYYPVFDLRAGYGNRRQEVAVQGRIKEDTWEEGTFEAGVQIPWKYIQGRFVHSFTTRAFGKVIKVTNKVTNKRREIIDDSLYSPGLSLSYNLLSRMAVRDLNPEWGLSLRGEIQEGRSITGKDQRGSISTIDGRIYLPGLWHHHSFYHQYAYERQRDNFYQYSSLIFYPRGTRSVFLQEFTKYSGNYILPLFYPDWNWSRYLYLKRIMFNAFYDELQGRYQGISYKAASAGWETLFEMNFLRIFLPFTVGVRGSYVLNGMEKDANYEIFLASILGTF